MVKRSRGRPPGPSTARDDLLAAARSTFAEVGYERASLRSIAAQAGVDPRLVGHYFGGKEELFLAAVELPIDPEVVVRSLAEGDLAHAGERLATAIIGGLLGHDDSRGRAVALVRAAASEPAAVPLLRRRLVEGVLVPVARAVASDEPELRATLIASQMVGILMVRHVVGVEPLASLPAQRLVAAVAPVVQHYLVDPLPPAA